MTTIRLTMAQALVRFLDQQYFANDTHEHKFIHGISGIFGHGNVTGLGYALEHEDHALPFIRGNNEQGLVHMATAFAKQHDRQKIMAVTSSIGPGATNMVTGAATATINRIPVLLLVGDTFSSRMPDPVLQQLEHPHSLLTTVNDCFRPVSKYFDRIDRPEQLISAMTRAMTVLTDPVLCGCVTICLPQDVQCESFDYPQSFFKKRVHRLRKPMPEPWQIEQAARLLSASERPFIVVGGGVHYSKSAHVVEDFVQEFMLPLAETQAGKSAVGSDFPLNMGGVGVLGSKASNELIEQADVIIALGTRLSDFTTCSNTFFSKPIISINVDVHDSVKRDAELALTADVGHALKMLSARLREQGFKTSAMYQQECRAQKCCWLDIRATAIACEETYPFNQVQVVGCLNDNLPQAAVVVAAAGSLPGDLQRFWHAGDRKGFHLEYGYSCMGYEIAGGLGVKMAEPHRSVWVLVGDGSFLMMHSEIVTAIQERQKINIVVFDSSGFNCIKSLQCAFGSQGFGTDLRYRDPDSKKLDGPSIPIDFSRYGQALGLTTWAPHNFTQLKNAIDEAEQCNNSTLIEVKVSPQSQSQGYKSYWRVAAHNLGV